MADGGPASRAECRPAGQHAALVFVGVASVAFAVLKPPVGDFWAARARAYAAAHGVGLRYWFGWFDGLVPGHYSVLAPYLTRMLDAGVAGAGATVLAALATHRLVRGSPHAIAATWAAGVGMSFSLWSGRVPFALGTATMVAALIAVRHRRPTVGLVLALLTVAVSPVSAAFLAVGLVGVIVHDRPRRAAAVATAGAAAVGLIGVELYFGAPGPEGFQILQAGGAFGALLLLLVARPEPRVRTVVLLALIACPVLAVVPNGMGSNFERFTWICLPVAVLATARSSLRIAVVCCGAALSFGVIGSLHDLYVAAQPMSRPEYTAGLVRAVDRLPGLEDHRLEVVPDGSHVAAYTLLGHAQLARGYETQTDNAMDAGLAARSLDAQAFRRWLDDNAVGWVAIDRVSMKHGPEDALIRDRRPGYLHEAWSDRNWVLYAVERATPIVQPPGRVVDADQAEMQVQVPPGTTLVRIRWSRFLHVTGPAPASIAERADGWVELRAAAAGAFTIG